MQENTPLLAAKILGDYARHFEMSDWHYTRNLGDLKSINYDNRGDGFWHRLGSAFGYLRGENDTLMQWMQEGKVTWRNRWFMAKFVLLRKEKHLPDGVLDNGGIITFWEETGEYINLVQPSVGAMLSDFLLEDPDNPHAQKISKEILRIIEDNNSRIYERKTD